MPFRKRQSNQLSSKWSLTPWQSVYTLKRKRKCCSSTQAMSHRARSRAMLATRYLLRSDDHFFSHSSGTLRSYPFSKDLTMIKAAI